MPSPPKPWERAGGAATASTSSSLSPQVAPTTSTSTTNNSTPPAIPTRSSNMATNSSMATMNQSGYGGGLLAGNSYGSYGNTAYGGGNSYSPYGSTYGGTGMTGYGNSYGSSYGGGGYSPYNRMGSNYGSTYGASTYGSSYGAGGYGGYNRMGNGYSRFGSPYGPQGGPGDMPLSAQMEQSTQATFGALEQVVQAFGGFAQMLDSTFMATHSSFMAMVGVAEQFGSLRNYLGQIFSLYSLYQAARRMMFRLAGKAPPVDASKLNSEEFENFKGTPKRSKKPILVFLFFTVGIPYLISKLFKRLQRQRLEAAAQGGLPVGQLDAPVHPSQLEFCRAAHDFQGESQMELSFKSGDVIAILSKVDPATGQEGAWWRGRLQDGRMGMFPSNYVEVIQKRAPPPRPASPQTSMLSAEEFAASHIKSGVNPESEGKKVVEVA
ncbi:Peroxin 13, N-terminal region-domain-containing protein [Phlyctochytrium arcticum]|nr:Peroxin 13, N-terminal region-domain-containing protein [Phlyctochytrium arcticum]